MSYTDRQSDDSVKSNFFAILYPRKRIQQTWTQHLTNAWKISGFELGRAWGVAVAGTEYSHVLTPAAVDAQANSWTWDEDTQTLYIYAASDPSSEFIVVTFQIFTGTTAAYWDSSGGNIDFYSANGEPAYYEPCIRSTPQIRSSMADVIYGLMPTQVGAIEFHNHDQFWNPYAYDVSWKDALVEIYHCLGELENANVKLLRKMRANNCTLTDNAFSLSLKDSSGLFDRYMPSRVFSAADYPDVDPNWLNRPIRYLYGTKGGMPLVNIEYEAETPLTSNNRNWVAFNRPTTSIASGGTLNAVGSNTATRTYVTSISHYRIGSRVWADRNVGTDEYPVVTDVVVTNSSTNVGYVDHTTLTGGALGNFDSLKTTFIDRLYIQQGGVQYEAYYGRDFTTPTGQPDSRIVFNTSMEANVGLPATLSPADTVFCTASNYINVTTQVGQSGPIIGGKAANLAVAIADLMKKAGFETEDFDGDSFDNINDTRTDKVGFCVPATSGEDFPQIKTVIAELLFTGLLRLAVNSSNLWELTEVAPIGASQDYSISDDDILTGSFTYELDYEEVCHEIYVNYKRREIPELVNGAEASTYEQEWDNNYIALYLHGIDRVRSFESLHQESADAAILAMRLAYIFGDRFGRVSFTAKNRMMLANLNDSMAVARTRMPGQTFDGETTRTLKASILETDKTLALVRIVGDDQKGVQDAGDLSVWD